MRKDWRLIPKILSGEKTIESRWMRTRRAPWNQARKGDTIFFRNGCAPVVARATVAEVLQFEIRDREDARAIVRRYGRAICLVDDPSRRKLLPKYCVLLRLCDPKPVRAPFRVDKRGFGAATAWMRIPDISERKII